MTGPRISTLSLALVGVLLSCPGGVSAQEGVSAAARVGVQEVELSYRPARKWKFTLPEHHWNKIGTSLEIGGRSFKVVSEGTALRVDTDGDGETDVKVEGDSAFLMLKGEGFKHAVRLWNRQGWTFASSAYLKGKIGGQKVRLFDLDNDGRFGVVGKDGIILGNGNVVSHLGQAMHVDGKLIQLTVAQDGKSLSIADFTGKTGKLALDYETKGKVLSLRIRSGSGKLNFDLARLARAEGGSLDLPVGRYKLQGGEIGLGENRVVVGPGRSQSFEVTDGGSVSLHLGGTVKAEFLYTRRGDQVQFDPNQIWYYGPSGEEYRAWAPIGKSPSFSIREQKSGNELAKAFFPGTS